MLEGWSIGGEYWTSFSSKYGLMLNFNGVLEGPEELDAERNHYVGWTIEKEWLWTGWKASGDGSFYSHEIEDMRFPKTLLPPQKRQQKNCKISGSWQKCLANDTWKMKNMPILANQRMGWGGARPYRIRKSKF